MANSFSSLYRVLDLVLNLPFVLFSDVVFVFLCTYVVGQFHILQENIRSATTVADLNSCVRHHQFILRCVDEMELIYQYHHFNQLFFSLVLFGSLFVLMFVAVPRGLKFYQLCITMGYLISIDLSMCHYSETIAEESSRVVDAAYDGPWHCSPPAFRRDLRFLMMRACKPAYLTGAGIVPVTLQTFASIMKLAYSVFTLLIQE